MAHRTIARPVAGPRAPAVAGRFVALQQLRRTGWGHVFLALDEAEGRLVQLSLTEPVPGDAAQAAMATRLRTELSNAARVRHAGVVPVLGGGRHGAAFYAVEAAAGGPRLSERLALEGPLPAETVRSLARDLIDALDAVHRAGAVHGAITTAAVRLSRGSGGPAVLGDLGLPRAAWLTQGARTADPRAAAPEQRGQRPDDDPDAGRRADWWALGAVLHEALTGHLPGAEHRLDIEAHPTHPAHDDHDTRDGSAPFDDGARAALTAGVRALLDGDPHRRPSSARDVRVAMGITPTAPLAPLAATERPATGPPRRMRRWEQVVCWALCAALVLGGGIITLSSRGASTGGGEATATVPAVLGIDHDDAVVALDRAGLRARVVVQASADAGPGTVIDQQPGAGAPVPSGSAVTITVSTGAGKVSIPDVLGLAADEAERLVTAAGLVAQREARVTVDAPPGSVVGQAGNPGNVVERGSTVRLTIAAAPG